jgi:hypothetical protein
MNFRCMSPLTNTRHTQVRMQHKFSWKEENEAKNVDLFSFFWSVLHPIGMSREV